MAADWVAMSGDARMEGERSEGAHVSHETLVNRMPEGDGNWSPQMTPVGPERSLIGHRSTKRGAAG